MDKIPEVNIVDAMCGSGKTSAAINYINSSSNDIRFLYITPYLDEVDRILSSCPSHAFAQPLSDTSKLADIKRLFAEGRNVVSTHALFSLFDSEVVELIKKQNYVLVMDEVADVVQPAEISKPDLKMLLQCCLSVGDDGLLSWHQSNEKYCGRFAKEKRLCDLNAMYLYRDTAILWLFPVSTFIAFSKVYILTYLFAAQAQKYYYDFYGVKYRYMFVEGDSVENYHFTETEIKYKHPNYRELIHVVEGDKINEIGKGETALSHSWYERKQNEAGLIQLKRNMVNFFRRIANVPSEKCLWTTFKFARKPLSCNGFASGFLSCNARATNNYRQCTAVAYTINKYYHPIVKGFFVANNIAVDEDTYAVVELIQWMWRSAIRDGKPIEVYLPSKRMRRLFNNWLDSVCPK